MLTDNPSAVPCPVRTGAGDDRKTAVLAEEKRRCGSAAVRLTDAAAVRTVLRSRRVQQAGFGAELPLVRNSRKQRPSVIFLEGEAHQRRRAAVARFFTPKVVGAKYRAVMEAVADELVTRFRANRQAKLEEISMELAVAVAGAILGLTNSDRGSMTRRLDAFFTLGVATGGVVSRFVTGLVSAYRLMAFLQCDVRPAVRARRAQRQDDVISHLIDEGYSTSEILTECLTYGAAGMVTTREFIVIACWHLLEHDDLRARFLAVEETAKIALLEEILRLEPVVGALFRRLTEDIDLPGEGAAHLKAGTLVEVDVRGANCDESAVGACPHQINADREVAQKQGGAMFSFGDGNHRCPGGLVAMQETAIFLDRLLRVPGLRLEGTPRLDWNELIAGYEVRGAIIGCDRA